MLYGSCYYPEQRKKDRWLDDLQLMREAGINALRITEFAWKSMEPHDDIYDFAWLDEFIGLAEQQSIQIVLCPPMRTVPAWLVEKDPSILIVTKEGHQLEYASRYTFCVNHPLLREKASRLASAMAARYGQHPSVIGWHLDNEIGDEPDCHCPLCLDKWRDWLQQKYAEIDQLNQAWGTIFWGQTFDSFDQIPTPRMTKADYNPSYIQAWRHFRSDCNISVASLLAASIHTHIRETTQYITTNNQMLWNHRTNYYEMSKFVDITGTNYYPPYGERCRSIEFGLAVNRSLKQAPFHVYELRNEAHSILGVDHNSPAPGELERLVLHTIANGADGVFFFPWMRFPFGSEQNHGAITDYDGQPSRIYRECQSLGKRLACVSHMIKGSKVVSEIALLYDFPSRWHMEHPSEWTGNTHVYLQHLNKLYHSVRKLGYNCDAVDRHGDFSNYKLLVIPMLPIVDDDLIQRLQQYVNAGGVIIFHPLCGIKNAEAVYYAGRLHPGMIQLLGSRTLETATSGAQTQVQFHWRNKLYKADMLHELVQSETAKVNGFFANQWFEGYPAVTVQPYGDGCSWFIATFAEERFYLDFLEERCCELHIPKLLAISPPEQIEITMRQHADGTTYIFVLNSSCQHSTIMLDRRRFDLWNNQWLEGQITIKPHGVCILI